MSENPNAKILLDSISSKGARLTTFEVTTHRYVLPEWLTHRDFSRNGESTRAIPISKKLERVRTDLAYPAEFAQNQKGMQPGEPLDAAKEALASFVWKEASLAMVDYAKKLESLGVHKQVTSRLVEPFSWHKMIITATQWQNFFDLRCAPEAQIEIRLVAEKMRALMSESIPVERKHHLPFIAQEDFNRFSLEDLTKASVAKCARISYLTHDGQRSLELDINLYNRLLESKHLSPFEHVAFAGKKNKRYANFVGWKSHRHLLGF